MYFIIFISYIYKGFADNIVFYSSNKNYLIVIIIFFRYHYIPILELWLRFLYLQSFTVQLATQKFLDSVDVGLGFIIANFPKRKSYHFGLFFAIIFETFSPQIMLALKHCVAIIFKPFKDNMYVVISMNKHVSLLKELAPVSHFFRREEQNFSFFIDFSVLVEKMFSSSFVLSPDCFRTVLVVCHSTEPYPSAFWRVQLCATFLIFEYLVNINIFLFHCLNVFIVCYSHFHNLNVFYCL